MMFRRTLTFRDAAYAVARRLALGNGIAMLEHTSVWVCGGLVLAMVAVRLGGGYLPQWPWVAIVLAAWIVGVLIASWIMRPRPLRALAVWDQQAGRGEAFLSAYCFEGEASPSRAKQVHLTRAQAMLAEAWKGRWRELPLPRCRRGLALPPLVLAVAVSGLLVAPLPRDMPPLDAEALARTRVVAESLADRQKDIARLDGMTPKEREAARELTQAMNDAGTRMAESRDQTPQGVLTELDTLARQAEALAKAVGGDAKGLSASMIEELERHADTTDFGAAIRASKTDDIAEEARAIAERLASENLTLDEQRRFEDALDRAMKAADETDREHAIGAKQEAAHQNLKAREPDEAGERFEELARQFDRLHAREQVAERLEQLAQELRGDGQRIMQTGDEELEQLAQAPGLAPELAMRQMTGRDGENAPTMPQAVMPVMPVADMPGLDAGDTPEGSMLAPHDGAPVPGEGDGVALAAGAGEPPVPGEGLMPGGGRATNGGMPPVPGATVAAAAAGASSIPGMRAGGLAAGHGTAKVGADPTKPHDATGTATVAAAPVNQGASTTQTIDGRLHREETARGRRESAMAFIAAEEEALHAEPLPASRREQVLRYFTMLREQLEHDHGL